MKVEEAVKAAEYWVGENNRTHGREVSVCLLQEVKSLRARLASALALIAVKDDALKFAADNAQCSIDCEYGSCDHAAILDKCAVALAAKMKSEGI